jgi:hypothetical protein
MLIDLRQPITRSGGWLFQKEGNYAKISSGKRTEDIIMAMTAAKGYGAKRQALPTFRHCRDE